MLARTERAFAAGRIRRRRRRPQPNVSIRTASSAAGGAKCKKPPR
jgi:hypothetical protein